MIRLCDNRNTRINVEHISSYSALDIDRGFRVTIKEHILKIIYNGAVEELYYNTKEQRDADLDFLDKEIAQISFE